MDLKITPQMAQVGRLAFREEKGRWNCYYAMPTSMAGALFLGSVTMAAVTSGRYAQERRAAFQTLMRSLIGDVLEHKFGTRPSWGDEQVAPERERAKPEHR